MGAPLDVQVRATFRLTEVPAPEGESPALAEARRLASETRSQALTAEIRMLDLELLSQPMRIELLKAQRDRTRHSVNRQGGG